MKKLLLSLLLILACSLPVQAAEMVTINDVNKDDVYNYILTSYMKGGFMIQENNEHSLIFRNNNTSMDFAINWGSDSYIQHAYNFAQIGKDTLVNYEIRAVSGNRINPFTKEAIPYYFPINKEYAENGLNRTLITLFSLKNHFNGAYYYGFTPNKKKKKDYFEIIKITPNYPAEKAGLKSGDKLIKINEQPIKKMSYATFDTIILRSSLEVQPIDLEIRRDKDILHLKIFPIFIPTKKLEAQ